VPRAGAVTLLGGTPGLFCDLAGTGGFPVLGDLGNELVGAAEPVDRGPMPGKSPSDTLNPHERPFADMLDRHPRSAYGRRGCLVSFFSLGGPPAGSARSKSVRCRFHTWRPV
jgi:hypothetical protein